MSLLTKEFSSVSNLTNGLDAIAPNTAQVATVDKMATNIIETITGSY